MLRLEPQRNFLARKLLQVMSQVSVLVPLSPLSPHRPVFVTCQVFCSEVGGKQVSRAVCAGLAVCRVRQKARNIPYYTWYIPYS